MVEKLAIFGAGVVTGVIITSIKFEKNPNQIFVDAAEGTKKAASSVAGKVSETTSSAVEFVKNKMSKEETEEEIAGEMEAH